MTKPRRAILGFICGIVIGSLLPIGGWSILIGVVGAGIGYGVDF